jgi:hypothetical protein
MARPRTVNGAITRSYVISGEQQESIETLARLWKVPQSWVMRYLLDQTLPTIMRNPSNPFAHVPGGRAAD